VTQWSELSDAAVIAVVRRTIETWFQGSHYVNVQIRRNGKFEIREADWLKHLPELMERLRCH